MGTSTPSARIESSNYLSGMITAVWTGNDASDGFLAVEGSGEGANWGPMGQQADDVGSVTINTANDFQQWAFPQGFPFPFVRLAYASGTNTTGSLTITFVGYQKVSNG